jgi:heme-degrading monooxygenase HmoA
MILEVAVLNVIPEKTVEFEFAFEKAQEIISSMKGWKSHELHQCLEVPNRYILLVEWENLEDHTVGFRKSPEYLQWKSLLHHFYSPFPEVDHYTLKFRK